MKRKLSIANAGLLVILAGSPVAAAPGVTFSKDIAPILWQRCAPCHRPGQVAPFSLLTYRDAAPRARQIVNVTKSHLMPPWLPEPGHGDFVDSRRMPDAEIALIAEWASAGAPEGAAGELPPPPAFAQAEWHLGPPDLVVEAAEPYLLRPGSRDVFRNIVIPVPLARTAFIRGVDIDPGNAAVVHHIALGVDRTPSSRRLDARDPEPGFDGSMLVSSAESPSSRALGWTPGMTAAFEPSGMAWPLYKGADIVLMLHLMPPASGQPQRVKPRVAFYFAPGPPTQLPIDFKLGSKAIDIRPGDPHYVVEDRFTLPVDVDLLSIYPHAHYLATDMHVTATRSDGRVEDLLWIKNWDFHWQDQYRYRTPVPLPKGTTIAMRYEYNNSAANKHNPAGAPRRVVFGPRSSDEMGDLWLRLLPRSAGDAATLARAYRERETTKDIEAGERAVARAPTDVGVRDALAAAYLTAGRIDEAITMLVDALRLSPEDAEAHNNLGHALELQGKHADALQHFERAATIAGDNDLVQLNLANALDALGRTEEALAHFERAIALNPSAADAHNNYGVALGSLGRIDEAIREFDAALAIQPDYADAKSNLELARGLRNTPRR